MKEKDLAELIDNNDSINMGYVKQKEYIKYY